MMRMAGLMRRWSPLAAACLVGVWLAGCGAAPELAEEAPDAPPAPSAAADGSWTVGPRMVPPPAMASDALRSSIASAPVPDPAATARAAPTTIEGWEAFLAQGEAQAAGALALAESLGVEVERDVIAGVTVRHVRPAEVAPEHAQHLFVHVHGGAYVLGGGDGTVSEAAAIAAAVGIPVVSVDYRMPPADPFPAAVDDTVAVFEALLAEHPAGTLALGGTSAGGALALSTALKLAETGRDLPGAIFAGTPWSDLTQTGDTQFTNEGIDRVLVGYQGLLSESAKLYAGDHDLTEPLLSPIYGDFEGFPPTLLVTGTRDLFLSDTVRTHRKLRRAGVTAELHVFEGMSHAGYLVVPDSPEAQEAWGELGRFLAEHLD